LKFKGNRGVKTTAMPLLKSPTDANGNKEPESVSVSSASRSMRLVIYASR
jgi:hypothetical protein